VIGDLLTTVSTARRRTLFVLGTGLALFDAYQFVSLIVR
jgi:hypothetical protein